MRRPLVGYTLSTSAASLYTLAEDPVDVSHPSSPRRPGRSAISARLGTTTSRRPPALPPPPDLLSLGPICCHCHVSVIARKPAPVVHFGGSFSEGFVCFGCVRRRKYSVRAVKGTHLAVTQWSRAGAVPTNARHGHRPTPFL